MGATGLGLLLEEHRSEIAERWRRTAEQRAREPALAFALAPLLRELALAFCERDPRRPHRDAWARCAVLVRSTGASAQLAREFMLLHRAIWDALKARGAPVAPADRTAADEWLQEALVESLERLERVRMRAAAFERAPRAVPPVARVRPPPLPPRSASPRASAGRAPAEPIEVDPIPVA